MLSESSSEAGSTSEIGCRSIQIERFHAHRSQLSAEIVDDGRVFEKYSSENVPLTFVTVRSREV